MIMSLFYIFLAILALSFLIFIHELGHYWMARRVGMRVETFAIGFGKPIYSWEKDGVKWQVGWLLFGGYVKIAGTESEGRVNPYDIPDGFFGKGPLDRIKVALMGPLVNLLFAFLIFALLWSVGGRDKSFSDFTSIIGWVDPKSELYAAGVRPGDQITRYDGYAFQGMKDHLYGPMAADETLLVEGNRINYAEQEKRGFSLSLKPYSHPAFIDNEMMTVGVFGSANYVIYDRLPEGKENPLVEGSPLEGSGIQYGDRIVWVDGELVFSSAQLSHLLNDGRVLVTVRRGGQFLLRRVPRVQAQELRPDAEFREELIDWQYEAGLNSEKFASLFVLPYNLTYDCHVENALRFIDETDQLEAFPKEHYSVRNQPLQPGDQIVAIQGYPVERAFELLKEIQEKKVSMIVERQELEVSPILWTEADQSFFDQVDISQLEIIAKSIGRGQGVKSEGNLHLLNPVTPKARSQFPMSEESRAWMAATILEKRKSIREIQDPEKRNALLKTLEESENLLILGLPAPQDRRVVYNPTPFESFGNVAGEISRTLQALFSGSISPKYLAGPVGIVQVVQSSSRVSLLETLFWLGAISLNLGFLNLLPIPILDGGTIVFSLLEWITGRRIQPKTLEKIMVVFAILLMSFFLFLTYNDIVRVFGGFLSLF